jgi:hypothetical protein
MPPAARTALRIIALLGCALLAILTVPDHSPTLLWKWPRPVLLQLMLALPAVWLLVAAIAAPEGRSGFGVPALAAVALMIGGAVVSAFAGPYSGFSTEFLTLGVGPLLLFLAVGRATACVGSDSTISLSGSPSSAGFQPASGEEAGRMPALRFAAEGRTASAAWRPSSEYRGSDTETAIARAIGGGLAGL